MFGLVRFSIFSDKNDPDREGLVLMLAEHALVLSPTVQNALPAVARFVYPDGERLRMFFTRDPARNDVAIEVQPAASAAGPWTTIATSTLDGVTAAPGYLGGDGAGAGVKTVKVRDMVNLADAPRRFLRVKISY